MKPFSVEMACLVGTQNTSSVICSVAALIIGVRLLWTTCFRNKFSLFQLLQLFNFDKQKWFTIQKN